MFNKYNSDLKFIFIIIGWENVIPDLTQAFIVRILIKVCLLHLTVIAWS